MMRIWVDCYYIGEFFKEVCLGVFLAYAFIVICLVDYNRENCLIF